MIIIAAIITPWLSTIAISVIFVFTFLEIMYYTILKIYIFFILKINESDIKWLVLC